MKIEGIGKYPNHEATKQHRRLVTEAVARYAKRHGYSAYVVRQNTALLGDAVREHNDADDAKTARLPV